MSKAAMLMDEPLRTAQDVAAHCGLKEATIRKLTYTKKIPCVRLGRRAVRYRLSDVLHALTGER